MIKQEYLYFVIIGISLGVHLVVKIKMKGILNHKGLPILPKKNGKPISTETFLRVITKKLGIISKIVDKNLKGMGPSPAAYCSSEKTVCLVKDLENGQTMPIIGILSHELGHSIIHRNSNFLNRITLLSLKINNSPWIVIIYMTSVIIFQNFLYPHVFSFWTLLIPVLFAILPVLIDEILASAIGYRIIVNVFKTSASSKWYLIQLYTYFFATYFMSACINVLIFIMIWNFPFILK